MKYTLIYSEILTCDLIRKNVVSFRFYGLGCEVRGKVERTLYGCTNVERQTEDDNYPVNMLCVNRIYAKKDKLDER